MLIVMAPPKENKGGVDSRVAALRSRMRLAWV